MAFDRFASWVNTESDATSPARFHFRAFAALLLATTGFSATVAAAVNSLGANGGEVRALHVAVGASTVIVAGTSGGGIFTRTLPNTSWSRATGTVPRYVRAIAGRGCTLAAASSTGIFRSTDCGLSWSQLTHDDTQSVAVDPTNANTMVAGIAGTGIVRSTDGGATWTGTSGLGAGEVRALYYRSTTELWAGLYGSGNGGNTGCAATATLSGGVFRSLDAGQTWEDVSTLNGLSIDNRFVSSVAIDGAGNVFVGTLCPNLSGKLFRAVPGSGWVASPAPIGSGGYTDFGIHTISIDPSNANRIWVGTNSYSITVSADNGTSFSQGHAINNEPNLFGPVRALGLLTSGTSRVFRGAIGLGVFATAGGASPSAESSVSENQGLTALRVNGLSINIASPSVVWMGGTGFGTFRSTDSGATFAPLVSGFDIVVQSGTPQPSDFRRTFDVSHIVAAPSGAHYATARDRGIYRFTSTGSSWAAVNETGLGNANNGRVPTQTTGLSSLSSTGAPVYWALFDKNLAQGVWRRDPNTASWALINTPNPFSGYGAGNVVQTPSGKTYALGIDFETARSTDGFNFSYVAAAHDGFSRLYFSSLAENPVNVTVAVAASNKGVYRSTDSGQNWTRVAATGLTSAHLAALAYSASGVLFSGDRDGKVWCSGDNGTTWAQRASLSAPINQIRTENGHLFYVTDGAGGFEDTVTNACP